MLMVRQHTHVADLMETSCCVVGPSMNSNTMCFEEGGLTSKAMMFVFFVWARAILMAFSTTSEPLLAKTCVSSPFGTILLSLSNRPT